MSVKRKTRMDRGRVYTTARVENVMRFIIEQDEVSIPQLQILLVRYSEPALIKPTEPTLSLTRTLNIVRKWKDAGLIEYRNPYRDRDKPASVYATRRALNEFGYDKLNFRVRDLGSLAHLFDINHVRLWMDGWMRMRGYHDWKWHSERVLRAEHPKEPKYPDAEVTFGTAHVACEIERSRKSIEDYNLIRKEYDIESVDYTGWERAKLYTARWYFHEGRLENVLKSVFGELFKYQSFEQLYLENGRTLS